MSINKEKVTFHSENALGDAAGVKIGNSACGKGVIVIHEWWGVNEQVIKIINCLVNIYFYKM